ncbi:MAG TPA: Maf family protein [Candidatus Baltobacteraceae bacterium]|nr:Maf family protein [Candidatus Baltobacteraceae bacterium]
MTSNARIVLASASPRRLELLRSLGLEVDVRPSGYHEPEMPGLLPQELASNHAAAKLESTILLLGERYDVPVLAADTVVDCDGVALGKPRDAAEAARMLELLSGREHLVHTAFALGIPGNTPHVECATTRVWFYRLQPGEIAEYVATGEPMDKAGAYGIQGRAAALVERIDGDFYTVMGLPLSRVVRAMRRLGFTLPKTK